MLIHGAVDLQLIQINSQYRKHCDRFHSFRCKHFHQKRIHQRNGFRLEQFDPFFQFVGARPIHGGALIVPNAIPTWISSLWRDPNYAWEEQEKWIWHVVSNYPQITHWDVVNELWANALQMRQVPWADQNEIWWIDKAFRLARKANPEASLFIKDFRPQDRGRWRSLFAYVQAALDRGVPIDGVSVQLHSNCHRPMLMRDAEWVFTQVEKLGIRLVCDETIIWDTSVISSQIGKAIVIPPLVFEPWQAKTYREYRELCEAFDCEMFGFWSPSDLWRDIWHYTDRPVWLDGAARWSWGEIKPYSQRLSDWEILPTPRKPFKQSCSPGLWRQDWSGKPVLSVFPELVA